MLYADFIRLWGVICSQTYTYFITQTRDRLAVKLSVRLLALSFDQCLKAISFTTRLHFYGSSFLVYWNSPFNSFSIQDIGYVRLRPRLPHSLFLLGYQFLKSPCYGSNNLVRARDSLDVLSPSER